MAWYDTLYKAAGNAAQGAMNYAPVIGGALGNHYAGPAGGIMGAQLGAGLGAHFNPSNASALRDQASDLSQYQLWRMNADPRFAAYLPSNRMQRPDMYPSGFTQGGMQAPGPQLPLPQGISQTMYKTDNPPTGSIWDRLSRGARSVGSGAYNGINSLGYGLYNTGARGVRGLGDLLSSAYRAPHQQNHQPIPRSFNDVTPGRDKIYGINREQDERLQREAMAKAARREQLLRDAAMIGSNQSFFETPTDLGNYKKPQSYMAPSMAAIYGKEHMPEDYVENPESNFFEGYYQPDSDLSHGSLAGIPGYGINYPHSNSYDDGGLVSGDQEDDGRSIEDLLRSLTPQQLAQLAVASGQSMGRGIGGETQTW